MKGRELRVAQLILGGAALVVFVVALVLSVRNPSLSYDTDVSAEDSGRVEVTCTGSNAGSSVYLSGSDTDRRFEVTDGEDSFDRVRAEEADQAYDARTDPHRPYGLINGDCAAAETTRAKQIAWLLAVGASLVAAGAAVTALRAARRGPSVAVPADPTPAGSGPDRADVDAEPGDTADRPVGA